MDFPRELIIVMLIISIPAFVFLNKAEKRHDANIQLKNEAFSKEHPELKCWGFYVRQCREKTLWEKFKDYRNNS